MNKLCYTAFVAFCSSIATIVALGAMATGPAANSGKDSQQSFTMAEVESHNTKEDCWMIIEGLVYDLTSYIDKHPTPPALLLPYCGTDATKGMRTKGYGRDHSDFAWKSLKQYQIGQTTADKNVH